MKRFVVEKKFYLDEFIPKEIYFKYPIWKLLRTIDPRMFPLAQRIRDEHGARILNDWVHGGVRNQSGLRIPEHGYYSMFSCHSYGRAFDSIGITPVHEIWEEIRLNYDKIYKPLGLTAIEVGSKVDWLHLSLGNFQSDELYEINID